MSDQKDDWVVKKDSNSTGNDAGEATERARERWQCSKTKKGRMAVVSLVDLPAHQGHFINKAAVAEPGGEGEEGGGHLMCNSKVPLYGAYRHGKEGCGGMLRIGRWLQVQNMNSVRHGTDILLRWG